jgi:hypothetical protein
MKMDNARVIREMLKENTGTHFLDSGSAYGRNWQKNQGRKFGKEPESTLSIGRGFEGKTQVNVTHNLYHWLKEFAEYDSQMTKKFRDFANQPENKESPWLGLMDEFAQKTNTGMRYGINTYNHDSCLNQVIQYVYFETDTQQYVLLQTHNGCDVRGGYTAPKAFRVEEHFKNDADASVICKGSPTGTRHTWQTDDAYHYYPDEGREKLESYPVEFKKEGAKWRAGVILVKEDDTPLCPICGAKLEGMFF